MRAITKLLGEEMTAEVGFIGGLTQLSWQPHRVTQLSNGCHLTICPEIASALLWYVEPFLFFIFFLSLWLLSKLSIWAEQRWKKEQKRERDAQDYHFQTKASGSHSLKYPEITSVSTFKHFLSKKKGICDNYSEEKQHLLHQITTKSIKHQAKSRVIELAQGNSGDGFHR